MTASAGQPYIEPQPAWQVTLDGQDITARFNPRLINLRLQLWRHERADELEINLDDSAGDIALPPANATLTIALGWDRGTGVDVGLIGMGSFVVDDVSWEGPPDRICIRAHSADLKDSFRTRKTRTWTGQPLSAITARIAADNGLTNRCHPDLADEVVDSAEQANQSDMEFLRDLGRRYDAAATVKAGCLIFAPIGATTTATGAKLPAITLTRQDGDKARYSRNARESTYNGAEANYHDQASATRKLHREGSAPHRRLKRIYTSAGAAHAAARAEHQRLKRAAAQFELTLALGNARIAPGLTATATGFKAAIDSAKWQIASVEHEMGPNGFHTRLEMEVGG